MTSVGGLMSGIDKKDFFIGFSNPVNREIMRVYKDLDMVEQLGSGMPRILSHYKKESFDFTDNFLRVTFYSNLEPISTQETTQETTKHKSSKERIVAELLKEPSLTRDKLANIIGISNNAVKQHLANLKKDGILKRVGSTKAGYWKVSKR